MLTEEKIAQFTDILREELIPAMGCTEPISIAYATAKARDALGETPLRGELSVSGNILKNAKSVTVPHTGGLRGIKSAFSAGLVAGDCEACLEVLSCVKEDQLKEIAKVRDEFDLKMYTPEDARIFDIGVTLYGKEHSVSRPDWSTAHR